MKQIIRIIGGQFRGRKISFPDIPGLRPTPDRVRETLFNWLMHDIRNKRCLDAFAGSGALGFEALSRGAKQVVMVEQSAKAFDYLMQQARQFSSPELKIIKGDALCYLKQANEQYDIIFLDPPFAKNYLPACIHALEQSNVLASDGLLYVESPIEIALDANYWRQLKLKRSGQVVYALYQKYRPEYET